MLDHQLMMRNLLTRKAKVVLDSTADEGEEGSAAADYASADIRMKAASILQEFAGTSSDDLADGESLADRLMMLVVGVIDADKDGEITDEEQAVADALLEAMWDYLADKGVSDEDCNALLNDWDADAAARVRDLLAESGVAGEGDEALDDLDAFAFDTDAEQSVFDSAGNLVLDAVYKKKVVVRGGRKIRINKRISGHVRLSAKQKVAVRKMIRKSHSAAAMMRRMKSMRIRQRAGL
jgi:hypothetical protein